MKMRNKYFIIISVLLSVLFLFNCSEVKDDISQPEELEGVHPDGFGKIGSDNFHSYKIQSANWDMTNCQKCHAADFSGGTAGVSCLDCHTGNAGPEACNTCHGVFADESKIAPPTDLSNNYETSAKGVGAHVAHVYENELSLIISCNECHPSNESGSVDFVKTHIDGLPAEMKFGEIASSGLSDPNYNSDLSCSNTYCHGNFSFSIDDSENQYAYADSVIIGNNFSPIWNIVDDTQAACGTCHGRTNEQGEIISPTPQGHFGDFPAENCVLCHTTAFNEDGTLNKSIHMNGEKNLK